MGSLGFTGTQYGVTFHQGVSLRKVLQKLSPALAHHGMCIGADKFIDDALKPTATIVHGHPPLDTRKMAECQCDVVHEPKEYLARNRDIVLTSEALLVAPKGEEELRSGTWSTVRFARKLGRPIIICWPDGSITRENV